MNGSHPRPALPAWLGMFVSLGPLVFFAVGLSAPDSRLVPSAQVHSSADVTETVFVLPPPPTAMPTTLPTATLTATGGPTPTSTPVEPTATPSLPTPVPALVVDPVPGNDPSKAVVIDGQTHTIPANSTIWLKFEYGPNDITPRPVIGLRLANGVATGVQFEVWAAQNLTTWWESKPVGRGTQEVVTNCRGDRAPQATPMDDQPEATEEPYTAHCPTNDLTWAGAFGAYGTFYVRVLNGNNGPVDYLLTMKTVQ